MYTYISYKNVAITHDPMKSKPGMSIANWTYGVHAILL